MTHKGFTLIELMIVVAIIGILAAVAIPQYQNYVARAQVTEGLSLASGAKVAIAEYFNSTGSFPVDNSTAGLTEPTDFKGNWVDSVTVSVVGGSALITALFSSTKAHSKLQGGEMTLTAVDHGGSIGFACSSSGTTDISTYLPSSCRDLTGTTIVAPPSTDSVDSTPVAWTPGAGNACWNDDYALDHDHGWIVGDAMNLTNSNNMALTYWNLGYGPSDLVAMGTGMNLAVRCAD
ncbi:MAG: pilin [Arenicellales bacterium]|jgi:type IV pilus assembly protein PilA|nr:pilin [Arenicellales bacterium]|tara:strand:- start:271 stop:972 length:702 start_codon:yes stop_codon:yes gene_type:complete